MRQLFARDHSVRGLELRETADRVAELRGQVSDLERRLARIEAAPTP